VTVTICDNHHTNSDSKYLNKKEKIKMKERKKKENHSSLSFSILTFIVISMVKYISFSTNPLKTPVLFLSLFLTMDISSPFLEQTFL